MKLALVLTAYDREDENKISKIIDALSIAVNLSRIDEIVTLLTDILISSIFAFILHSRVQI